MFKLNNKNKISKISNSILILMFIISLLSCITTFPSLIKGDIIIQDGYKLCDYWASAIFTLVYMIISGISIFIFNTKIDLYKDDYSKSMKIFNLIIMLSLLVSVLSFCSIIINLIVCKQFALYNLVSLLLSYVLVHIVTYLYVIKNNMLSKENDKNKNIVNFIVIYLTMSYISSTIVCLLNILFNVDDIVYSVKNLVFSLLWIMIIMLAYKLLNRKNK